MNTVDPRRLGAFANKVWDDSIVSELTDYIRIPNKSPMFDPKWQEHGHMDKAVDLISRWCREHAPEGTKLEVVRLPGKTPLIYMDVPGKTDDTVLLYGHLDKQPEMVGWAEGKGPWIPVLEGDKLYGRGGADDGYAAFASVTALAALAEQNVPHARAVVLIEACEESGSADLPAYIEHLADRIGRPSLVVCLDSGCANYDQIWCTTSLRGMASMTLSVELLSEGVHSGDASGLVASSFRVLRTLLDRLEDSGTGHVFLPELHVDIPPGRIEQARKVAGAIGNEVFDKLPFLPGVSPVTEDNAELILNRTWRPTVCVTGADGLPPLSNAGNVMRPLTAVKLSLRFPPTLDAHAALARVKDVLLSEPPYGAKVRLSHEEGATGWDAPPLAPWLAKAADEASQTFFDRPAMYMGEGGSIPFMGMLGERFPDAQFFITGVLGPHSNAHGPNEFLHIPMGKKLTASVAHILATAARS